MTRTELDRRLNALSASVLLMGSHVETAVEHGMEALIEGDQQMAAAVIAGDDAIDDERAAIEEHGACLITLQQPAVRDLRAVLAAMAIADDLERIGDYAEGIAQLVSRLEEQPSDRMLLQLSGLAALARVQLQGALDAYRACDPTRARDVWTGDKGVDSLYDRTVRTLLSAMHGDPDALTTDTYLLWIAHNLERIADRATNICERVVYIVTGEREVRVAS